MAKANQMLRGAAGAPLEVEHDAGNTGVCNIVVDDHERVTVLLVNTDQLGGRQLGGAGDDACQMLLAQGFQRAALMVEVGRAVNNDGEQPCHLRFVLRSLDDLVKVWVESIGDHQGDDTVGHAGRF